MKRYMILLKNEMKLNIRDMNMIIFAVCMPLIILVILGFIYGTKPAFDGASYAFMEQSFGAVCVVSILTLSHVAALFWKVKIHGTIAAFLGSWMLTMLSTLSIGLMVGGLAKNAKQAGVIASLLYFPMLVFSGTTLPIEVMPEMMQKIVSLFPLTQGITLMKCTFLGLDAGNTLLPILVMVVVTVVCTGIAVRFF